MIYDYQATPNGKTLRIRVEKDTITLNGQPVDILVAKVLPTPKDQNEPDVLEDYIFNNAYTYELPATGGCGTAVIYFTGFSMIAAAVYLQLRKRKQSH